MLAQGAGAQGTQCIVLLHLQCCLTLPMHATGSWTAFLLYALLLDQGDAL